MATQRKHSRLIATVAAGLAAAVLAACSSPVKLDSPPPVTTATPQPVPAAPPASAPQSQVTTVDLAAQNAWDAATKSGRVVYFDFDSYAIRPDAQPVLESFGKALSLNKDRKLMLEGHTDAIGGREYNLALGQKRAEAVQRALTVLGAVDAQLEAVSYGKERPAVEGGDESARAQNRRVELKDR